MYFTSCNIFENIYLTQKAKKDLSLKFLTFIYWRSGFASCSPLYVNSPSLFESRIERNISGTYFISIYLLRRNNNLYFMFLWITILSKIPWADNLSCHYILGTLGFTLRKSLPPAAEMTSLWSFLQWPSSRTSSPVLWPLTDSNQPLTLDNAWGFFLKVTNAIWSTFGILFIDKLKKKKQRIFANF